MWSGRGGPVGGGIRVDKNEELKFLGKFKKIFGGGGSGRGGVDQGGFERRIEVFGKIQKKNWGGGEFLGKFKKNNFSGGGGGGVGVGVRVDVNEELKFLGKLKKKKNYGGSGGGGGGGGGQVGWGVRVDVNEEY